MTNDSRHINLAGTLIETRWFGPRLEKNDNAIVFLHEGLGCIEMWRDFPKFISNNTGLPSFTFSRQGYGRSDPVMLPRSARFMHDEGLKNLPNILDIVGINRAVLVGHSDGASIALISAGGTQDPRIEAVVCIAGHVFNEDITIRSIQQAKHSFKTGNLREKLAKYHGSNVDCAFWGWNDIWLAPEFRRWNIEHYLPKIKVPTLIIQGEDDQYGTSSQVEAIQSGIGERAKVEIIKECGHSPHIEQPDLTLDIITRFVSTLPNTN